MKGAVKQSYFGQCNYDKNCVYQRCPFCYTYKKAFKLNERKFGQKLLQSDDFSAKRVVDI